MNKLIDHTLLKADSTQAQIQKLCEEARTYDFASVCVNPTWVKYCAEALKGSDVKVCTVIGFPLGAATSAVKAYETKDALANGAEEFDMVINIGALKDHNYALVVVDIRSVVSAADHLCVTVENVKLMKESVHGACKVKAAGGVRCYEDLQAMVEAGADRIGTSAGVKLLQKENVNSSY